MPLPRKRSVRSKPKINPKHGEGSWHIRGNKALMRKVILPEQIAPRGLAKTAPGNYVKIEPKRLVADSPSIPFHLAKKSNAFIGKQTSTGYLLTAYKTDQGVFRRMEKPIPISFAQAAIATPIKILSRPIERTKRR